MDRLVELNILQYHEGEFWTLTRTAWQMEVLDSSRDGTAAQFVKTRISKAIFDNEIPDPRDIIIICLINTCDVFRFIFQLDDEAEERIKFLCKMDVIGRSMAEAVSHSLAGPLLRRSALTKKIPTVSLRKLLFNPHVRDGNLHALFADLSKEYGPGLPDPAAVQEAHDLPGRTGSQPMGAPPWAHVPEGQGLLQRL